MYYPKTEAQLIRINDFFSFLLLLILIGYLLAIAFLRLDDLYSIFYRLFSVLEVVLLVLYVFWFKASKKRLGVSKLNPARAFSESCPLALDNWICFGSV
jgi:hypothetical protein